MLAGDLIGYRDGSCLEIGSCLRSEDIYGDVTGIEMEMSDWSSDVCSSDL